MLSPWQAKHEDGGDDEDDVEGGEPDQKAVDGALHLWPAYKFWLTNAHVLSGAAKSESN